MSRADEIEKALEEWGNQLLRPGVRKFGRPGDDPRTGVPPIMPGAQVRKCIRALVRGDPEVMVKVTGGGRGMRPIKAHLNYMSRRGELVLENERGESVQGRDGLAGLVFEWKYGGSLIPAVSHRREAFHVMLSMPPEVDAGAVWSAARAFARDAFAQHKYAIVLHHPAMDPASNRPHVHLIVRAGSRMGRRLNPRKADLARWREEFAERLRERGVAASATRRHVRGILGFSKSERAHSRRSAEGPSRPPRPPSERAMATQERVLRAWLELARALGRSSKQEDRKLAVDVVGFVGRMPVVAERLRRGERTASLPQGPAIERATDRGPDRTR